jgi:hypothetical protein
MTDTTTPARLNIDDMTRLDVTLGHGPQGWILNISALGTGSTTLFPDAAPTVEQVTEAVAKRLHGYFDRMTTLITEK